ncbi:MAG: serine hydrolase [Bacteroidota bacterium]
MPKLIFPFLLLCLLVTSLAAQKNVLERIIRQEQATFGDWAAKPEQFEIQVLYTQIDRDENGVPTFTTHRWGADPNRYFYPASTVKMPAAFLAMEKLNELGIAGLDAHAAMHNYAGRSPQTAALADTSSATGLASVAHYARKIFLVSDNDAFNRLYEFLGQRYFNERLRAKGLTDTRIIHRLSVSGFDTLGNRYTNPVAFYGDEGLLYQQGERYSRWYDDLGLSQQLRGKGYINSEDETVLEPFDFSYKNYVSTQDLHDIVKAFIFPNAVAPNERFNISTADREWLLRAMLQYPQESDFPRYGEGDNYVKFWLYGDQDEETTQIPEHIRILNKVGWAYGFLTDAAYIVDLEAGVEFILVGTIHTNANQIYNDGEYEYKSQALPFFGELGRAIYEHELKRKRRYPADLTPLKNLLETETQD